MMKSRAAVLTVLYLICVGLLAWGKTTDIDSWIHLACGKLLWGLKHYPASEPFVSSMADKPFWYSSWLFGTLYYVSYVALGTYGIILLKIAIIVSIFAILLKDSLLPAGNRAIALVTLITTAVFIRERFVERPDTVLMIFLPFSILALRAYIYDGNRRYLYCLPLIHLLWANTHSSINIMFVPFGAVLAAGVLTNVLSKRTTCLAFPSLTAAQFRLIGIILVGCFLLALVSPYGFSQFTVASQFLKLDVFKQEIFELRPPFSMLFWWFFFLVALLAASFLVKWRRFDMFDFLVVLPFAVLGFTSNRFTYIFAVVAAPVLARNISDMWAPVVDRHSRPVSTRFSSASASIVVAVWIVGITAAAVIFPRENNSNLSFGFDLRHQPEGALAYMDRRNVTGQVFCEMHWGQYIEFRDFPKRAPFMDGRAYITPELFEQYLRPTDLNGLARKYGFDSYLVAYPRSLSDAPDYEQDLLQPNPSWALVYWDDKSLLYLRRGSRYESVIQQDEYRAVKPANTLAITAVLSDPGRQAAVVAELQRNIRETDSSLGKLLLGHLLLSSGAFQESLDYFAKARHTGFRHLAALDAAQALEKLGRYQEALTNAEESLRLKDGPAVRYVTGSIRLRMKDAAGAIPHLQKALAMNPLLVEAYPQLIGAYRVAGKLSEAEAAEASYQNALNAKVAQKFFAAGVQAYAKKDYSAAAASFQQSIAIEPRNTSSHVNLGYVLMDQGRIDEAAAQMKRALDLDIRSALAHYGIAMIYKRQGNLSQARVHWQTYLQLEPQGHFARMAKQELAGGGQ